MLFLPKSIWTVVKYYCRRFHTLSCRVRTGRANASILDGVNVDYYGTPTPIKQVGQISTPEARLLQIQPFDKSIISEIEKAENIRKLYFEENL